MNQKTNNMNVSMIDNNNSMNMIDQNNQKSS